MALSRKVLRTTPSTTSQTPITHYSNTCCVKLTIVAHLSFSERIAIANLSFFIKIDARGKFISICLKKNQNAPRPSEHPPVRGGEMSKRIGGIKGCKYQTSSWHLNGFLDGNNIG